MGKYMLPQMTIQIYVKTGGDHGGKLFKACYQVVNKENPDSKDNTIVFSLFEAKDLRKNLRTGLERYKTQIYQLQLMEWR